MSALDHRFSRRRFLQASAAVGATVSLGGIAAACNIGGQQGGTFNWMTWGDHYMDDQLEAIEASDKIIANITELSGNAEGFAKVKEVKGQLDVISGDALWVPAYYEEGLIEPFDINELKVASQLYPLAREFKIWTTPEGYLGYPIGWSPVSIYYNPKFVDPAPDSWEVLLDPKYKGRVVVENMPEDTVAYMGKAAGMEDPYNMTDDQLATVKGYLEKLKPNILRFAVQASDGINVMISEEAWIITGNLGSEDRIKEGGGPEIKSFIPKEGTVGWFDAEMTVKEGVNKSLIRPFLELAEQAEYIAQNFLSYGRPLFNEAAYKILVNQGEQARADRYLYNKPETVDTMTLRGPGLSTAKSIQLFNDVFGA